MIAARLKQQSSSSKFGQNTVIFLNFWHFQKIVYFFEKSTQVLDICTVVGYGVCERVNFVHFTGELLSSVANFCVARVQLILRLGCPWKFDSKVPKLFSYLSKNPYQLCEARKPLDINLKILDFFRADNLSCVAIRLDTRWISSVSVSLKVVIWSFVSLISRAKLKKARVIFFITSKVTVMFHWMVEQGLIFDQRKIFPLTNW